MDAWVKDVLVQLLIAILGTAVGYGSLFVLCRILYNKLMKKRWQSHINARETARVNPAPISPDGASGDQPLPQAETLHDMELGQTNRGEEANLPSSLSPDDGNAAEEYMEMTSHTTNEMNNVQAESGEAASRRMRFLQTSLRQNA